MGARRIRIAAFSKLNGSISDTFRYGAHPGKLVVDTLREFQEGRSGPEDLPPLVAAEHNGRLFVIFDNRRLAAKACNPTQRLFHEARLKEGET